MNTLDPSSEYDVPNEVENDLENEDNKLCGMN